LLRSIDRERNRSSSENSVRICGLLNALAVCDLAPGLPLIAGNATRIGAPKASAHASAP
jgi:hypothetical protein